ncbi:MAG: serine/threonine protein kinase [Polyangiaceae bacterium]|nr:serine/threonine protein kinase [Polyangiaceae bacterium]
MSEEPELPSHWQPGTVLAGRFRVIRVLGIGGMGAVLEAENVALGQRIALKVLRRELLGDKEAHSRLDQEARVVSQLVTDHVARVHDLGKTEQGEPFIVMELLAGRNLDALIEAPQPIQIARAVDVVCEACVGLAVAHAAGMVHRDIKPGNLFVAERVDGSDIVKVLDFGLIKVTRSDVLRLTTSATVFGTPLYMSPEQIMSSKNVDARTDQHAMAMVLFELLTKNPPYYDETPTAVTVKIATLPPPSSRTLRPEVPPGLDAVLLKGLAKAPADRFEDIALFALALAPYGTVRADAAAKRAAAALNRPPIAPVVQPIETAATVHARSQETVTGLSTKRKLETQSRARFSVFAIAAAALVGIGATAFAFKWFGPPGSPKSDPHVAAAGTTSQTTATPIGSTDVVGEASAKTPIEVVPSSSAVAAPASASAEPTASAAPAKPAAAGGKRPQGGGTTTAKPTATPTAAPGEFIPKYK